MTYERVKCSSYSNVDWLVFDIDLLTTLTTHQSTLAKFIVPDQTQTAVLNATKPYLRLRDKVKNRND